MKFGNKHSENVTVKRGIMTEWLQGALPFQYHAVDGESVELVDGGIIDEVLMTIYVNATELATIMCSPLDEEALTLGFLYNEGVISSNDDVRLLKLNRNRTVADVFLQSVKFNQPRRLTITSGCGGGQTSQTLTADHPPLHTGYHTTVDAIRARMVDLRGAGKLYNQVRGVHTAILCTPDEVLISAEDVGRHNTIDKLAGKALQQHIGMKDHILMASGRISSEMINKARIMGVPIVASRTAPTSQALDMAQAWNICVIGYVRQASMRVYTHSYRVGL